MVALFNAIAKAKREAAEIEAEKQAIAAKNTESKTKKDIRLKTKSKKSKIAESKNGVVTKNSGAVANENETAATSEVIEKEGGGSSAGSKWMAVRDDLTLDRNGVAIKVCKQSPLICFFVSILENGCVTH